MLTQFFQSINWVDVVLAIFFCGIIFRSVKSGFIAEGFRFLGTVCAVFVALHFYSFIAKVLADKTAFSVGQWEFFIFWVLWLVVAGVFLGLYHGVTLLFKIEANHQAIDRYAAAFLGAARGIFVTSLAVFAFLLLNDGYFKKQTLQSYSYHFTAKAAPNTYKLIFDGWVGKVFEGQRFNDNVFAVIDHHGINPKRHH